MLVTTIKLALFEVASYAEYIYNRHVTGFVLRHIRDVLDPNAQHPTGNVYSPPSNAYLYFLNSIYVRVTSKKTVPVVDDEH